MSLDPFHFNSSITYEVWLDQCHCSKLSANNELNECYIFREATRVMRERAWNDIKAQQDATDYTLRKRIYQTQKARNEMEWQKLKVCKMRIDPTINLTI